MFKYFTLIFINMFIPKYVLILSILLISLFVFLNFAGKASATQFCTLDIYVKDQNNNPIAANIYVDDSFRDYDDYITISVPIDSHKIEVRKPNYESDIETFTCFCSENRRVDLVLRKISEEVDIRLGSLDVDTDNLCINDDKTVRLSIPITLENGNDDTFVVAKFFVIDSNDKWHYIGKDEQRLDSGNSRTFSREFNSDEFFFDEGTHDVKVTVQSDDFEKTVFSDLHVNDCFHREYPYRYYSGCTNCYPKDCTFFVGSIDVNNEYPDQGDVIRVTVPITQDCSYYSHDVYVYDYVDDILVNSVILRYDGYNIDTHQFTVDTGAYANGPHTIKVRAEFGGREDTSTRVFVVSPVGYYATGTQHCLSIDRIWTDGDLKAGESNKINVKVSSCGTLYERNVAVKLEAFSNTLYTGQFDIPLGGSRDAAITLTIPEDVSGKQIFKVTAWNSYTSDTFSKDFIVYTGEPFIDIKPEFTIDDCQRKIMSFDVINKGKASDIFTISLTGSGAGWVTGVPTEITLNPGERSTVNTYVSVPCGTESGFYEFTITAKGSPQYAATSSIHVTKTFKWPSFNFPTGSFVMTGLFWLPWILIILLALFLLLFFTGYISLISSRRKPMFHCYAGHGC